jgi:hypothetical protein
MEDDMNEYFYKFQDTDVLNLSSNIVSKNARLVELYDNNSNILKNSFLTKLNNFTPVHLIKVFHNPPNVISKIHEDVDFKNQSILYAINLVLTPEHPGAMEWYLPKITKLPESDSKGVPCINYTLDEIIDLACKTTITTTPVLVRIDKPHRVITGDGNRTCISIRCKHNFASWEEAVTAYKQAGF